MDAEADHARHVQALTALLGRAPDQWARNKDYLGKAHQIHASGGVDKLASYFHGLAKEPREFIKSQWAFECGCFPCICPLGGAAFPLPRNDP